jgi:hypothetical protein
MVIMVHPASLQVDQCEPHQPDIRARTQPFVDDDPASNPEDFDS